MDAAYGAAATGGNREWRGWNYAPEVLGRGFKKDRHGGFSETRMVKRPFTSACQFRDRWFEVLEAVSTG
jgi:hypothetical protein